MVVANSLVTVPSCCSAPAADNKSTLNEAPKPRGSTQRCDRPVSAYVSPPSLCISVVIAKVGFQWRQPACVELMCVFLWGV